MPTLRQSLEALPHRDVRGIATRLGTRRRGENRKEDWIERIIGAWSASASRTQIMAALSPAALRAAVRLTQGGEFPAPLFFAEYGSVRRPRPGQRWQPPPWEAPQTISEELYYCGLLTATPPALLERAVRLTLPADLRALFTIDMPLGHRLAVADEAGDSDASLLHDVAQTLCFLVERPGLTLLHGRWLTSTAFADLNSRLLRAERTPLARAHARTRRLRLLFFLATAAGLCSGGSLTPLGWLWLAEPPAARLTLLWNAWRMAPLALRHAYRQATAVLPEPWPDLALKHLVNLPPVFTAAQLGQAVLGQETAFAAYFTAHLSDISALDAAASGLIETLAADWGAIVPVAPDDPVPSFSLTDLGRWLIAPMRGDLPASFLADQTGPAAQLSVQEGVAWRLTTSSCAPPLHLAHLAPYAQYMHLQDQALHSKSFSPASVPSGKTASESTELAGSAARRTLAHVYQLDEGTVAAAAAAGHGMPDLLQALAGLGVQLTAQQQAVLQAWHARGHELQLTILPLLRAARPELLARLFAYADVRVGLGELLSPTVVVAALPPADLVGRLRSAGFFPQGPGIDSPVSGRGEQVADETANASCAIRNPQSAALWLAGQLYAALGEHTTLPLPPPFAELTALLASLPPLDRAVVQAQWERLRDDLQTLLDGRTFAPPPEPSDPERWRPLIESAVAAGRSLTMRYFTAGRNVLTQRTVTPYWIEDQRGILYLRADCHLAGRVLLFRLDRIQEIQESGTRDQESVCPQPPAS